MPGVCATVPERVWTRSHVLVLLLSAAQAKPYGNAASSRCPNAQRCDDSLFYMSRLRCEKRFLWERVLRSADPPQ
jgi:hypothetical protein